MGAHHFSPSSFAFFLYAMVDLRTCRERERKKKRDIIIETEGKDPNQNNGRSRSSRRQSYHFLIWGPLFSPFPFSFCYQPSAKKKWCPCCCLVHREPWTHPLSFSSSLAPYSPAPSINLIVPFFFFLLAECDMPSKRICY